VLLAMLWTEGALGQNGQGPPPRHQLPLSNLQWKGDLNAMLDPWWLLAY